VRLQKLGNLWFESTSVEPLRVNAEKKCLDSFSLFFAFVLPYLFTSFVAFVQPTLPSFSTDVTGRTFFPIGLSNIKERFAKKPALRLFTFFSFFCFHQNLSSALTFPMARYFLSIVFSSKINYLIFWNSHFFLQVH
jgi:hypothetical protein